ncbi:MAG: PHP domain-containing protein [Firmicutes bacterium]|nr:PHP domain-containing protein [Bacillota bacterium]
MDLSWYGADLHVHTALSPCAHDGMSPSRIVRAAGERGISILGITDHNSAANAGAVTKAAEGTPVRVLPGMEVQTREEVHVICLFETVERARLLQDWVYERLPELPYSPQVFGRQILYDEDDRVLGECTMPLYAAVSAGLDELALEMDRLGGIMIAAHVDRPAFSVIGTLGFIPPDVHFDAVEISQRFEAGSIPPGIRRHLRDCGVVRSSDAHSIGEVGSAVTAFHIAGVSIAEMRAALRGEGLRRVVVLE